MSELITVLDVGLTLQTQSVIQWFSDITLPPLGHDILAYGAFGLYLLLILGGGLTAVLARNLVRAMIGLVVTFLGVAGMYLLMATPFLAFMQLLIYVGAICVLIFFAIMLVRNTSTGEETNFPCLCQSITALAAAGAVLALFGPIIVLNGASLSQIETPVETNLAELGEGLLSYYVIPFEIISIVLLVAMAGGVLLAWDKKYRGKE